MLWLVHIRVPENCLADLEYIEIRHFVGEFTTVSAEYLAYYFIHWSHCYRRSAISSNALDFKLHSACLSYPSSKVPSTA